MGDEFYSFQIDELSVYLKKAFGLRVAQGATVAVNNQSIQPSSSPDPTEHFLFGLTKVKDERRQKLYET